jgi:hypothetical protein
VSDAELWPLDDRPVLPDMTRPALQLGGKVSLSNFARQDARGPVRPTWTLTCIGAGSREHPDRSAALMEHKCPFLLAALENAHEACKIPNYRDTRGTNRSSGP